MIIDDFLPEGMYQDLKQYSMTCRFQDITNPIDGVTYPDIAFCLASVSDHITEKLNTLFDDVRVNMMFLRMSKEGTPCPHVHHNDVSHGTHSLMLYLDDQPDAGTSMVIHESGIKHANQILGEKDLEMLIHDQNDLSKWSVLDKVTMRQNRAFIFDAGCFHRAEPVGGYGTDQAQARIVLTCFFSGEL